MKRSVKKRKRLPVFTERFRDLQGEMSNTEFADFLGISRQTVGFYCNGDRIPDAAGAKDIAKKCNVSVDFLVGLSKFPTFDAEERIACETTGLSVEAVRALGVLYQRSKGSGKAVEADILAKITQQRQLIKEEIAENDRLSAIPNERITIEDVNNLLKEENITITVDEFNKGLYQFKKDLLDNNAYLKAKYDDVPELASEEVTDMHIGTGEAALAAVDFLLTSPRSDDLLLLIAQIIYGQCSEADFSLAMDTKRGGTEYSLGADTLATSAAFVELQNILMSERQKAEKRYRVFVC